MIQQHKEYKRMQILILIVFFLVFLFSIFACLPDKSKRNTYSVFRHKHDITERLE